MYSCNSTTRRLGIGDVLGAGVLELDLTKRLLRVNFQLESLGFKFWEFNLSSFKQEQTCTHIRGISDLAPFRGIGDTPTLIS